MIETNWTQKKKEKKKRENEVERGYKAMRRKLNEAMRG